VRTLLEVALGIGRPAITPLRHQVDRAGEQRPMKWEWSIQWATGEYPSPAPTEQMLVVDIHPQPLLAGFPSGSYRTNGLNPAFHG
jgi:hypothetical protein